MEMVRGMKMDRAAQILWDWKKPIGMTIAWYFGLVYFRDELDMGEFYLLASGFWVIYLVGFQPREPGELSAYSHFNENHERILGDLDPRRAGRELTGQILYDNDDRPAPVFGMSRESTSAEDRGHTLGRAPLNEDDDADLQRALLISLREEREARRRKSQQ